MHEPEKPILSADSRVGVLLGGMSPEREISLESGRAVAGALRNRGWDVVEIDVGPDLAYRLRHFGVDVAWIALHGEFGEDGCVQGMLEIMRIPYTGSGPTTSAVAMNKLHTKRVLAGTPLHLPPHRLVDVGRPESVPPVAPPVVLKAPTGGSTLGTWVCRTDEEVQDALHACGKYCREAFFETWVEGKEITVAVLDGRSLPVVGIVPKDGFFDFEAKYTKGRTTYEVPAEIPQAVAREAREHAEIVARVLGVRGIARADFLVDAEDRPWFLEINTIPGMTETSLSPMAAGAEGISFDELVEQVLEGARLHLAPVERPIGGLAPSPSRNSAGSGGASDSDRY